jgi:hypothetical protein
VDLQISTFLSPFGTNPIFLVQRFRLGILTQPDFVFPNATQLDSKFKINTGDVRFLDAIWRDNTLWVVFTINPISGVNQGQATVHWVRCRTAGFNVSEEAQGDVGGEDVAPGTHTYFPSVAVNSKGLVAFGYSASSPTTFAGSYISVGTSEQSFVAKSGLAPYVRVFGGDGNRWGDYSSIAVDPTDDSFWSFNAFADTRGTVDSSGDDGRWGTAWGRWACGVRFFIGFASNTLALLLMSHFQIFQFQPPTTPAPVFPQTATPVRKPCGLFGFRLFCPFTLCGIVGSFFGLCRN